VADVETNERVWGDYDWSSGGDEWSKPWGGAEYQWSAMLYPRIRAFLPAATILEIAPGHGRWTQFLLRYCERLIGVDVAQRCVDACRERFAEVAHASFHKNDGLTLDMVGDGEVDFAISFDSLVHAEADALRSYVGELARTLSVDGVAFVHHSNLHQYVDPETGVFPHKNPAWRGRTMSAKRFEEYCRDAGLMCIGQELVRWVRRQDFYSDSFSMLTRPGSKFARENHVIENYDLPAHAIAMRTIARFYGSGAFPGVVPPESEPRQSGAE